MLRHTLRTAAITGLAVAGFACASAQAADPYKFDTSHTQILFSINHLGTSIMHGSFLRFDPKLTFDPDNPAKTKVDVTIDTASIDTMYCPRDRHLMSPDFFNVEKFPAMSFKSTKTEVTGKDTAKLTGNLTLLGVTKPVTLDIKLVGSGPSMMNPKAKVYGFSATGKIKRGDFGMTKYLPNLGDEVDIAIVSEINNLPPPPKPMPAPAEYKCVSSAQE